MDLKYYNTGTLCKTNFIIFVHAIRLGWDDVYGKNDMKNVTSSLWLFVEHNLLNVCYCIPFITEKKQQH